MRLSHRLATCVAAIGVFLAPTTPAVGQAPPSVPRTHDGKPNLNGIWQAMVGANWNLEDHGASAGPFFQEGAVGAIPAGQSIVDGGDIPYTPAALAKRNENSAAVVETMGLCTLSLPDDMAQISAQRRAVVALTGKAAWANVSQHPDEAAADYRQLLVQYPNEPGVHYAYGLYLMETDLTAALAEFQKEVLNTPKHWPALLVMASIHIRQGTAEPAIQSLREAMKIVPAKYRWLCHAELGRANMTADNLDTAIAEFRTAVRLMPSNANVHYFLSEAFRRAGRKTDAQRERAEFEKLKVQQDPLAVPSLRPFASSGKN